ncbi:hypothetical protein [Vogesella sp. XCS3]|uniref:hypothetical protein n=1 Tax=Vogesella sp. XCS3 TaxID=2877939 RepID=UPI001D0B9C49|nr:hypothetical protein [Vogesella sp. XCS3]UDM18936.1 hypothetical protein LCH97_17995 [Vogesella sp. XCS3]
MSKNRDNVYSRLKVMQSAAGWYVGRSCFEQGVETPGSRESGYCKDADVALRRLVAFLKDEGDLDAMVKHTLASLGGGNNADVFDVLNQDAIAQACLKDWALPESALANINRLVAYYEQHIGEIDLETPADVSLDGSSLYASPLGVALEGYDGNATVKDLYDHDAAFAIALIQLIPDFEYPDFSHKTVGEIRRLAEKQHKDKMQQGPVPIASESLQPALGNAEVARILSSHDEDVDPSKIAHYPSVDDLAEKVRSSGCWGIGETFVCSLDESRYIIMKQIAPSSCEMMTITQNGFHDVLTADCYEQDELVSQLRQYAAPHLPEAAKELLSARGYHGVVLYKLVEGGVQDLSDAELERAFSSVVSPNVCMKVAKELIEAGMTYALPQALIAVHKKEIQLDRLADQTCSDSYENRNELHRAIAILKTISTALYNGQGVIDLRDEWTPDDFEDGSLSYEIEKKKTVLGLVMDTITAVEQCGFVIDHELAQSMPMEQSEIQAANRPVSAPGSLPSLG